MVAWESILLFLLTLAAAAFFGWFPFYVLERISMVDQVMARQENIHGGAPDSRAVCPRCGQRNDPTFDYCKGCGGPIISEGS